MANWTEMDEAAAQKKMASESNYMQALSGQIQGVAGISGLQQDSMRRLKRANAIIEILRVFYGEQVKQAEQIADTALKIS